MGTKPRKTSIEGSFIETLPPELLSDILDYLPSYCVYRLYLCGSAQLQRVLTSQRAVKSLIFDLPASSNLKWPIFPSYFAHLRHYAFKVTNSSLMYSISNMNIHVLPSSLVKLELRGQSLISLFFDLNPLKEPPHPFMVQYQDLNAILPLLEVLKLSTSGVIGPFFFSCLPRGLLVLVAYGWHIPVSHRILGILPPNLTVLDLYQSCPGLKIPCSPEVAYHPLIYRYNDTLEDVSFPNSLENFMCSLPWACGVIPFLPSSVTSIAMNEAPLDLMLMHELSGAIPPNVTTFSFLGNLHPNSVQFLPRTLTQLDISGYSEIDWSSTPFPLLTRLPNSAFNQEWTLQMVQALPRSLTTWRCGRGPSWTYSDFEQIIAALPRSLRELNMSGWVLTPKIASMLPPDLTDLSGIYFDRSMLALSEILPPSITRIQCADMNIHHVVGGCYMSGRCGWTARNDKSEDTPDFMLYPYLGHGAITRFRYEKLVLRVLLLSPAICLDLFKFAAPTLQQLSVNGSSWIEQAASVLSPLRDAAKCTWLQIYFTCGQVSAKQFTEFLKSLPHSLTHLSIHGMVNFDVDCFRCLPPHLTVLEVVGDQLGPLPEDYMRCLPKSLTTLKPYRFNLSMTDFGVLPASVSTIEGSSVTYRRPIEVREFS